MDTAFQRQIERTNLLNELSKLPTEHRETLIEEYRKRSDAAFAPATLKHYKMIIRLFNEWCEHNGVNSDVPIPPSVIAAWIDDMGGRLASTTIETRLWGIAELHRSQFLPTPTTHRLVLLALKSVKRKYGSVAHQAPPLGKKEILQTISRLGESRTDKRDKAVLWIATDSWCRASEICNFRVRDLIRQDDGSSLLYVSQSKTDQFGRGSYAFLSSKGTQSVVAWIDEANLRENDPIIVKSQKGGVKKPIHPSTISRLIRRCTERKDVSAHSTRVGGVQDAFRLGCDLSSIMVTGRWTSPEMPARYARKLLASQSAAAKVSAAFD